MNKKYIWIGVPVAVILIAWLVLADASPLRPWHRERRTPQQIKDESQIRGNIENYVSAISAGDLDTAKSICTEKVISKWLGTIESARESLKGYNWSQRKDEYLTSVTGSQISISYYQPDLARGSIGLGGHGGAGEILFTQIKEHGQWVIDEVVWVGCD